MEKKRKLEEEVKVDDYATCPQCGAFSKHWLNEDYLPTNFCPVHKKEAEYQHESGYLVYKCPDCDWWCSKRPWSPREGEENREQYHGGEFGNMPSPAPVYCD